MDFVYAINCMHVVSVFGEDDANRLQLLRNDHVRLIVGCAVCRRNLVVHEHRLNETVLHRGFDKASNQLIYVALADRPMRRVAIVAMLDGVSLTAFGTDAVDHLEHACVIPVDSLDGISINRRHSDFLPKTQSGSTVAGLVATIEKRELSRDHSGKRRGYWT